MPGTWHQILFFFEGEKNEICKTSVGGALCHYHNHGAD
jgi:hypothetical protein